MATLAEAWRHPRGTESSVMNVPGSGSPSVRTSGAKRRFGREPTDLTVTAAVARFALAGVIALAIVGLVSVLVMRHVGTNEALKNAREVTRIVGKGIIEPNLSQGVVQGRPAALARFDRLVRRPRASGSDRPGEALAAVGTTGLFG